MLYQDFISNFPPSNSGEFTEKNGEKLNVTWMMFKQLENDTIPNHAKLEINLNSLEINFSIDYPEGKKIGYAIVKNDMIEFENTESEHFYTHFVEKVQLWFNSVEKPVLQ